MVIRITILQGSRLDKSELRVRPNPKLLDFTGAGNLEPEFPVATKKSRATKFSKTTHNGE